jgi:hypothetical protein
VAAASRSGPAPSQANGRRSTFGTAPSEANGGRSAFGIAPSEASGGPSAVGTAPSEATGGLSAFAAASPSGTGCPHCAAPLKGLAARRLGVCAGCVVSAPGAVGQRARALVALIRDAARDSGQPAEGLVSPNAMLRLLDRRPSTARAVAETTGVGLRGRWAQAAAEILRQ